MSASVYLHPGREKSLLRRHPWIFASAVHKVSGKPHLGDTVEICDSKGKWLARGAWSPDSQIRIRMWTFNEHEVIDNTFFLRRLEQALALRASLSLDSNALRLVAAESDGLPGVTIDRYDAVLVCQLLSAGADRHRDKIAWALQKLLPGHSILERSDQAVREKEGLVPVISELQGDVPAEVTITESGLHFLVNVREGHKTGFYLDQRYNRQRIAAYAEGREVLNCFSYTGAMALHCLRAGALHVCNLDASQSALDLAARNLHLNGFDPATCTNEAADVFAQLRSFRSAGRMFDMVILDPPKFVENKQHLSTACRGYKDINLLALQLLRPGGILATFSCSGLMPEDLFHKLVADAALDAGRQVHFLEKLSQDRDHPVMSSYPEGWYLKGLICHVL